MWNEFAVLGTRGVNLPLIHGDTVSIGFVHLGAVPDEFLNSPIAWRRAVRSRIRAGAIRDLSSRYGSFNLRKESLERPLLNCLDFEHFRLYERVNGNKTVHSTRTVDVCNVPPDITTRLLQTQFRIAGAMTRRELDCNADVTPGSRLGLTSSFQLGTGQFMRHHPPQVVCILSTRD